METIKMHVEIPIHSKIKYELNKDTNLLEASRVVPIPYPASYGFIPDTLAEDNDPLDIFLIDYENVPTVNTILHVQPIGMIEFIDNGEKDYKIISTFVDSDISDLTISASLLEIKSFLQYYKPNKKVMVGDICDSEAAHDYINVCRKAYKELQKNKRWYQYNRD